MIPEVESIFLAEGPIARKLDRARDELLDLSARNRLLNMPRSSRTSRSIQAVDEKSAEVYRLLVREGKAFTFLPGRPQQGTPEPEADEIEELAQPEDDTRDERGVLDRHADTKLQTRLTPAGLQKRLLELYLDARTLEDEQGVNILYLALGTLRWVDPHNKALIRLAPLVLVPVFLERASAKERFRLKWRQEDCSANLSLEAFVDRIHLLKLPPFAPGDDFDLTAYTNSVAAVVAMKEGWSINADDIVLGFFSYAKFLMYRDLDPANWPTDGTLMESGLIRALLQDGFPLHGERIADDEQLDERIRPADMRHIHDSDSSQVLAAYEARRGDNLVIQGPPGTGKSQTIANIIGEAVADGKTVLFVSEKMAALEVVKRRLDAAGVGEACLELHSNKANKRMLLDELRRTWDLGAPKGLSIDAADAALDRSRSLLNRHAQRMHQTLPESGLTLYQVIGQLARIQRLNGATGDLLLHGAERWNADDRRERFSLLQELIRWIEQEGQPSEHPWWGTGIDSILPIEAGRICGLAGELSRQLNEISADQAEIARTLELCVPVRSREFDDVSRRAQRVSTAPMSVGVNLGAAEWTQTEDIASLLELGNRASGLRSALQGRLSKVGWQNDTAVEQSVLDSLPGHLNSDWFTRLERLDHLIPQLITAANAVRNSLGLATDISNGSSIRTMLETAKHVAAAPAASPETFAAAAWDHGIEQVGDLVDAVASLDAVRQRTVDQVSEAVWELDCVALRQTLAAHGGGTLRWLSSDWRRANRNVKSILRQPEMPLSDVLIVLDDIAKGRKLLSLIQQADGLGSAAFGAQWRGDRSSSAALHALLDWVKSLGTRSRELRELVAGVPDLKPVRVGVSCLEAIWVEFEALLDEAAAGLLFESRGGAEQVRLEDLKHRTSSVIGANRACRELFVDTPEPLAELVRSLTQLSSWRQATKTVTEGDQLGFRCFGDLWKSADSDWSLLGTAARWVQLNADIRHVAAKFSDPGEAFKRSESSNARLNGTLSAIARLFADLVVDCECLFGVATLRDVETSRISALLERWSASREDLSKWVAHAARAKRARMLGLGDAVDRLESGALAPSDVLFQVERAYYWAVLVAVANADPDFARFDGATHAGKVDEFVRLEGEHRQAARVGAMRAHYERIPHGGAGPVGILRAEIARRRGHMPIRQLVSQAGAAIQALKPVMMMSPLSVAQFLPPGEVKFDLLVMDEASQIQPVDALGAIARCRQAVVVGDERQLPPTRFFARMTGGPTDEEDSEAAQVADVESILGLFLARGTQARTLRWHYRSEHHSLIAVSNNEFYDRKLCILPSPYTREADRGIKFHYVQRGVYDSGNTRTNPIEARAVAEAVMDHAHRHPGQTLGVGTFSVAQRRAILDQLELLRRSDAQAEVFFSSHPNEPFFVKNLENIQGDERDVIFISVGYGKNAQGQMAMRFGPLSSQGGERRLNVLITRARKRCEVFASITDRDIDVERAPGKGVTTFQLFLRFARTGQMEGVGEAHGDDTRRAMEEDIAGRLRDRGYNVDMHVGVSGAFVDIAVLDSENPGRYILGVECDGLSYSSARSARDRDRLRRESLIRQGWILYRIWSMEWYQRPLEQLERLISVIEAEKQQLNIEAEETADAPLAPAVERDETTGALAEPQIDAVMYVEAVLSKPFGSDDLLATPPQAIATAVAEVVQTEGPIHQDEVVARVRSAWGLLRTGPRIQEHLVKAIRIARASRGIEREGKFLSVPGRSVRLRNRSNVASRTLRLPEMLPPAEIRAGVVAVVAENFGARQEEIVSTVLRRLGYSTTSSNLREVVEGAINSMLRTGLLVEHADVLVLVDSASK